ncbi:MULTISPECIES: M61 family metallopeptidase [unclassified Duganella]|uniref:M61 family metallopeptidase n=1 Tax=unclassified Duganella TaxID=2636909 RepID=UPI000886D60A|nr:MULTISPECIES: M61 family metallopeptidase [unclassified Duganella]SDF49776.1 Predicted metalloprotease, contains C-terminal PDZ domain [Duganella sp. OV458]SDI77214.1 glycyl aminopeptidase. Metallo peptidase. MEROPS family M61 [Duganella sp. OV510]
MKKLLLSLLILPCLAMAGMIPAPRDIPFKGDIQLAVDASDSVHKIFRVRETIPVQKPGAMVLLYPQWETGSHSPTQEAAPLAGLMIHADGRRLDWRRDDANPYAFHINVPSGARAIQLEFQYLPAAAGPKLMSRDLLILSWQKVALYPAGWYIRNVGVQAELTIPDGFQFATSLETARSSGNRVTFKPANFEDLVDAPVYAGRYYKRIDLDGTQVRLNMFGDSAASLDLPATLIAKFKTLATAVPQLFRSQHYRHFDFLMSLSDVLPSGGGVEHQESTEINVSANYARDPGEQVLMANLVAHEFIHSWNGRTRQPADLYTPNLNLPMRGSLLWVYEGQTEFWAHVISTRQGLRSVQQSLDALAVDASLMANRPGRAWKSLQDSTVDALYMPAKPVNWRDWQRREDYYAEGVLLWLDVDMLLRALTKDRKSMLDFAAVFFGAGQNTRTITTYTFEDVCKTLNKIAPYDWAAYFKQRLHAHDDTYLLDGLKRGGYRLVYTDQPTEFFTLHEVDLGGMDLSTSLGLVIGKKGAIKSVAWEGPAFKAGISLGARLVSVGGQPYTDEGLKQAIRDSAASKQAIALDFEADGAVRSASIPYFDSLRYPRLERIPGAADRLRDLLLPSSENQ